MSSADIRPLLEYSTIDIGTIVFTERPNDDDVVAIPGDGLRLSSHDQSGYPMVRLEHLSRDPQSTPTGNWDYQRTFTGVVVGGHVSVLSLFGGHFGRLNLPDGRYNLRLLRRHDEPPVREEEPPQFIAETTEEAELDGPTEDPVEHWLLQFWPNPWLRAIEAGGRTADNPTVEDLHDLLADMNLRHRFVIFERLDLEPADQHYMQVYLNDDMSYQIEYREGGADKHYQAHVPTPPEMIGPAPIAKLMDDWAHDQQGWREAVKWVPMPL
ncbi:hypothetical protein [Streptomyces sp. NPDC037389]|uniref:hypothetical protein n=1 Tax=Streptomyces sp. NPDC037389 TaxID=3155369 RepID=UPI0034047162